MMRRAELEQRQAELAVEEVRHPEQIDPPDRIGHELRDRHGPRLAVRQERAPRDARDRIGRVARDVRALGGAEPRVRVGAVVEQEPQGEPSEPHHARRQKRPTPAESDRDERHHHRGHDRADVGARVEQSGCEGALRPRKPLGDGLDGRREISRFAEAEREARRDEPGRGCRVVEPDRAEHRRPRPDQTRSHRRARRPRPTRP